MKVNESLWAMEAARTAAGCRTALRRYSTGTTYYMQDASSNGSIKRATCARNTLRPYGRHPLRLAHADQGDVPRWTRRDAWDPLMRVCLYGCVVYGRGSHECDKLSWSYCAMNVQCECASVQRLRGDVSEDRRRNELLGFYDERFMSVLSKLITSKAMLALSTPGKAGLRRRQKTSAPQEEP